MKESKFRQIFKAPKFEWCDFMAGTASANGIIKSMMTPLKERYPNLFQACPYIGRYEILNITLKRRVYAVYAPGIFSSEVSIMDDETKAVLRFSVVAEFTI